MTRQKRVLITGGCGFLGSHAIERYHAEGYNITVVDNFSTATLTAASPILKHTRVVNTPFLEFTWYPNTYDLILHLASPVGPVGILKHSGNIARYILDDLYWAIEGSRVNDCPLIFISTSEIYGFRSSAERLSENADKLLVGDYKVRNEYSVAKLLAEIALVNTAKVVGTRYQIIRPFNISGRRQLRTGGFVLPTFVHQAINHEDITVFGDGSQIRSFTHVTDIVDGIYKTSITTEYMNNIWNIGTPDNACTIRAMAEKVKKLTGSPSPIVYIDPKTIHGPLYEEAWDKIPESSKITRLLGWKPTHSTDQIIQDVIDHAS